MGIRVAVDLIGGDVPGVVAGVVGALDTYPDLHVVAVGPESAAADLIGHPRVAHAVAGAGVTDDADPLLALRSRRDAPARVAARCVRDGTADAAVSCGPVAMTTAAAEFVLGLVPGVTRPAVAVSLPTDVGSVLLLDASGAASGSTADELAQRALLGAAVVGTESPAVVGLLTPTPEAPPDPLRQAATELLLTTPVRLVGPVGVADMLRGTCDVAVTDGFSGGLVRSALAKAAPARYGDQPGLVVGVAGVVVAGASPSASAVSAAVALAADAVRRDLPDRVRAGAAALVSRRRELAGMR